MSVDKKVNYDVQGGVKNYLGKQQQVKAPLKWKSSPDSPETELAYITKAEQDLLVKQDLHGSLQGGVNRGPSGIMSLDGYGSYDSDDPNVDTGMSGAATSAAESGGGSGADARELAAESGRVRSDLGLAQLPPGVVDQNVQDYRNQFIAAGGGQRVNPGFFDSRDTVSPAELTAAKAYAPQAFKKTRGGGLTSFLRGGGLFGNLIKGLGQRFGLGKKYNEPTYDMRRFSNVNPDYYNDLDNELMLSPEEKPTQTFNFDNSGMVPSNLNNLDLNKLEAADLNNLQSLLDASTSYSRSSFIPNNMPDNVSGAKGLGVGYEGGMSTNQYPTEGIMGIDVGQDDVEFENNLMAFAPNSKRDRALKNLYSGYENLGIEDPQMIDLMQQDLQENQEKGTPLSLPQNAYSLIG